MRNLVKSILVVLFLGSVTTSCTKAETIAEEDQLYMDATEGDEEKKDDKPEN